MKGLRLFRILCVELLFLIQSVVGPHTQLCFSSCRKSAADCEKTFVSASLGDSVLHPEVFGAKTTVPKLAKNPGNWTATVTSVVNLDTGKPLFGWFHVQATGNPSAQTISIQAESQHSKTNGIGLFMFPSDASTRLCEPTGGPEGILPCYMVKSPYHMSGTAYGYSGASVNTFDALHQLDVPPCPVFDSKRNFRYRMYLMESPTEYMMRPGSPTVNLKDYAYGASDPEPPKGRMVCGTNQKLGDWMLPSVYDNADYVENPPGNAGCAVGKPEGWSSSKMLFYGRCPEGAGQAVKPGVTPTYTCNERNDFYNNLRDHDEYIRTQVRSSLCESCQHIWNNSGIIGHSTDSKIGQEIWGLRKCHGVLMTIFTIFLLPVSAFLSRYFKETFMSTKVVHLPIWYAIHIHMSMSQLGTLSSGLIAAVWARSFFGLGTYTTSVIHVVMGWVAVLFFLLAFLSSSFRLKVKKARLISIFLHCVWGNAAYGLCLIGMITSCVMPGSPSTRSEVGHAEGTKEVWIHPVFELGVLVPVLVRIVLDVVFNIIMMFNLRWADKQMGLGRKRKFAVRCIPMPLYNLNSKKDIPGGTMRKCILGVYILVSLLLTLGISVIIIVKPSKERFFGPMRYTHKPNGKLFAVNRLESYHL